MNNKSGTSEQIISLPKGGGELKGIGETFTPDLHTGTGNFSVPISLPAGRNGFQPELTLVHSTGNGNSCFGLGWQLSVPGISRKTSKGIPQYFDNEAGKPQDTFLLAGAEDLIPVDKGENWVQYQPRTEGLFALTRRYLDFENDYWEVRSKNGTVSWYGTPGRRGNDPACIFNPQSPGQIFCWKLSQTQDPFGNQVLYDYLRDLQETETHYWNELYLHRIRYIDYEDGNGETQFLASVELEYDHERSDAFSVYSAGFEVRTTKRCRRIAIYTHPDGQATLLRSYGLVYEEEPLKALSLLTSVQLTGHDAESFETLPPLTFNYTTFEPHGKDFIPVGGHEFTPYSLSQPNLELLDLNGNGLPDIVQMNGVTRYWKNLGYGQFDLPRTMRQAPVGIGIGDPGVQLMDANGEGKVDLVIHRNGVSGYFPTTFQGEWDSRSFRKHKLAPTFNFQDPEAAFVDLNGDGVTDLLRSGSRMECYFNDPEQGWHELLSVERKALDTFPNVQLSDSRVRLADMNGDGLQDIVYIHDGSVEYWPFMGYGRWGKRIQMGNSPRFPLHYDPKRILLGDVSGGGSHDVIYVDHCKVLIWVNQNGNKFSDPIEIDGTPSVTDVDALRIVDLLGTGTAGILWSGDQRSYGRPHFFFLDLTGGIKPFVLSEMNNHNGAITKVEYKPSTHFYRQDAQNSTTRWKTHLPFPVQVVARVEVIDEISRSKLVTVYSYHHGHWDGAEREFRGFGRVEQKDSQSFENYTSPGLHGGVPFQAVEGQHYTPPTLTKTWFHLGPVGEALGDWRTIDYHDEYWQSDLPVFDQAGTLHELAKHLPRRAQRDFHRALRGSMLRTELYALDGNEAQETRPYTVTESAFLVRKEFNPEGSLFPLPPKGTSGYIFFPFQSASRTTQWERGDDPMSQLSFSEEWDDFGNALSQITIACPRGWRQVADRIAEIAPFLATYSETQLAYSEMEAPYIKDRAAKASAYEILHRGEQDISDIKTAIHDPSRLALLSQSLTYYDGPAFEGLPFGQIGLFGMPVRTESIVIDEQRLWEAYKNADEVSETPAVPPYLAPDAPPAWAGEYPPSFRKGMPPLAGYTFHDGGGEQARGYWAEQGIKFDAQEPGSPARGLTLAKRDALRRETSISYDSYHFQPLRVDSPLGLSLSTEYDYRLFQAKLSTDPNGIVSMVRFSPLGFVKEMYLIGKEGVAEGDALDRDDPDAVPSTQYEYDFHAFEQSGQPIFVKTIVREHHLHDENVPESERENTITKVEFSDGFGRLVQTRAQAEDLLFGDEHFGTGLLPPDPDGPTQPGAAHGKIKQAGEPENVVVSGWKIYNNKGLAVQQYEPYYDKGFGYSTPEDPQFGKKSAMHYDPRGQIIRTVNPDGSEQRVVYGIPRHLGTPDDFLPSPWEAYTYDANDLAPLCSSPGGVPLGGRCPEEHHFTPSSVEINALNRVVKSVKRQRLPQGAPADPLPPPEEVVTRYAYDIRGNLLSVADALSRTAFRYVYDLTFDEKKGARAWRTESLDAGVKRLVFHALGMAIEQRDAKGSIVLQAYDAGNRLTHAWASNLPGDPSTLRQHLIYGDAPTLELGGQGEESNFKGKLWRHFDEAGLVELQGYDFKYNVLASIRRTIRNEAVRPHLGGVSYAAFSVDWERPDAESFYLETKTYRGDSSFDALNRPKHIRYPEDTTGERKALLPSYNRAGNLESISLLSPQAGKIAGVEHIAYNARSQRTLIAYSNGLMTRYEYEPDTSRLARLRTEKYERPDLTTFSTEGGLLQDFAYTYDLTGNIARIRDRGTGNGINGAFPFERQFRYDALYRLTEATGIEHQAQSHEEAPWLELLQHHTDDLTQARRYRQQYAYDPVGNLLELRHRNLQGEAGHFTRTFQPASESNRLLAVAQGGILARYEHDPNGNMTLEGTNRHYHWNSFDQLVRFRDQPEGSQPTVDACYLYGADGARVKKIVLNGGGLLKTSTYIGGAFEHHTRGGIENDSLHLLDGDSRIASLRAGTPFDANDPSPSLQYFLSDHLGNVQFVVNENGSFLNREEFYPFGGSSFGGSAHKRFGFTGREQDAEHQLSYHHRRYYHPAIARWISADPASRADGDNLFAYCRNNPVALVDPSGLASDSWVKNVLGKIWDINWHGKIPGTNKDWLPMGNNPYRWTMDAGKVAWKTIKNAANNIWSWAKENQGLAAFLGVAAGIALLLGISLAPEQTMDFFAMVVRTGTNAALGYALWGTGGAIAGAVMGAYHAGMMAWYDTYNWDSGLSWLAFALDNTWSVFNSFAGSLFLAANVWNTGTKSKDERNSLYLKTQWFKDYDTTIGNVTVGTGVPLHESVHAWEARIAGPTYFSIVLSNYIVATIAPYWLKWDSGAAKGLGYFKCGVYPNTVHELIAYAFEGHPC